MTIRRIFAFLIAVLLIALSISVAIIGVATDNPLLIVIGFPALVPLVMFIAWPFAWIIINIILLIEYALTGEWNS